MLITEKSENVLARMEFCPTRNQKIYWEVLNKRSQTRAQALKLLEQNRSEVRAPNADFVQKTKCSHSSG